MRIYKGTTWALWRWSEVVTKDLARLYILKTPWFGIAVHWIMEPSFEVDMHDHPMAFLSIVLRGWYIEKRQIGYLGDVQFRWIRYWNYFSSWKMDRHRISNVSSKGAMTLVFEGPKVREWGFHTPAGWKPWREYLK